MRIQDAKLIQIVDWLASQGIHPAKTRNGKNGLEYRFHSPLRKGDSTPSFVVNIGKNIWRDHGVKEGGNILNIVSRVCGYDRDDIKTALSILDNSPKCNVTLPTKIENTLSLFDLPQDRNKFFTGKKERHSTFQVTNVRKIKNSTLIEYLNERKIDVDIARKYLQEVYYTITNEASPYNGRTFFALGFSGGDGYEIRNRRFKGFTGTKKDITIFESSNKKVIIFEGWTDFLSYLTLKKTSEPNFTCIILNSTNQTKRCIEYLNDKLISEVDLFLDNDTAGRVAKEEIEIAVCNIVINDKSVNYIKYTDLNEWLVNEF